MDEVDVAIVGAGAAGLMAAIFAARQAERIAAQCRILALDGAARIGAKILIAGGGRCNVTHDAVTAADFNGTSRNTIARILRTFDVDATVGFFESLGVSLKREETGKLFPVTDSARTVLDALIGAVQSGGIRSGARVVAIRRERDHFILHTPVDQLRAQRIVLAAGGRSVPQTGSDGGGYDLARALGHSVTATFPGLVPLLIQPGHWLTRLSGVSAEVELTLHSASGKTIRRERGSILFTHFGVSGPVVLDMSRHWIAEGGRAGGLSMNVLPGMDFSTVDSWLIREGKRRPRATLSTLLQGRFPERMASALLSASSIDPATHCGQLDRELRRRLSHTLTALALPITGDRGFRFAEVTAGGVPLTEIHPSTMESRLCPGLYLCGEILDVDGRIGGYNFQWAWASGRLAGLSAVGSCAAGLPPSAAATRHDLTV